MRRGLTLIELLIVIGTISLLLQMILPAIEMSREAARRSHCANQLRQIGLAAQNHESTHGYLPAGGWGYMWMGDPDRGTGSKQPGSWAYQLLPFLEAQNLYDMGRGTQGQAKHQALAQLAGTPFPLLYCPSRRLPKATPNRADRPRENGLHYYNATLSEKLARMDYVGNHGDKWIGWGSGPEPTEIFNDLETADWTTMKDATGVIIQRRPIQFRQITDGLSKTYFAAEKVLVADQYHTGKNTRDDQSCWNGDDYDTVASTQWRPFPDLKRSRVWRRRHKGKVPFGSAHPNGFNAVLCDGSVQFVAYDVALKVHKRFGNRKDE